MTGITLLPDAERQAQPWKNGGGVTREIAVFPAGADLEAFDWRISTASVAAPGRFSHFDGVDRVLAVIEGRLHLRFEDGNDAEELTADSPPLAFAGDVGVFGTPVGGGVADLNVMVRRGVWMATIERITPGSGSVVLPDCAIVLMMDGGCVRRRSELMSLEPCDAVRIDGARGEAVSLESGGATYVVRLAATG